jgi:hypothetical protein
MGKNKRRRDEQNQKSNWLPRVLFTIIGAMLITLGAFGLRNGVGWIPRFSSRTGSVDFDNSLQYVILGVIFVLMGWIPWNWLSRRLDKRKD